MGNKKRNKMQETNCVKCNNLIKMFDELSYTKAAKYVVTEDMSKNEECRLYFKNLFLKYVEKKNIRAVDIILRYFEVDPNYCSSMGYTALWYATHNEDVEMFRLLTHFGADSFNQPNFDELNGESPLMKIFKNAKFMDKINTRHDIYLTFFYDTDNNPSYATNNTVLDEYEEDDTNDY